MIIKEDKDKSKRNTKILYTVALLIGVNSYCFSFTVSIDILRA